jgi:hypothetical protein
MYNMHVATLQKVRTSEMHFAVHLAESRSNDQKVCLTEIKTFKCLASDIHINFEFI